MSPGELFGAYPNARKAIAYVELILCEPSAGEGPESSSWAVITGSGASPAEVVGIVRNVLVEELSEPAQVIRPDVLRAAIAQCDTADFRRYVAGKLGAV